MGDLKSSARAGIRWSGIAAAASAAVQVLRVFVLARFLLGPDEFGLMSLAVAVTYVASPLADMGTLVALIHRQNATRAEISSLYWFNALLGLLLYLLLFACAPYLAQIFAEPRLTAVLRAAALVFVIDGLGTPFLFLLKRDLSFRLTTVIETRALLLGTAITLASAWYGAGVWSLVAGVLVLSVARTLQAIRYGIAQYPLELRLRAQELKAFLGFGVYQTAQTFVVRVSERFDQIILGHQVGTAGLGLYSVAYNLASMPVVHILPLLSWPAASALARAQDDDARLARGYLLAVETMMMVNASVSAGLLAIAPIMVPLVLGSKWAQIVPIFQWLCVVTTWQAFYSLTATLVIAKGAARLGFRWRLGLTLVLVAAALVGARLGGAIGLAMALTLVLTLAVVPFYLFMVRGLIGPCLREFAIAAGAPTLMAAVMALIVGLAGVLLEPMPSLVALASQILLGAVVFAGMLTLFRPSTAREMILVVAHPRSTQALLGLLAAIERLRHRVVLRATQLP